MFLFRIRISELTHVLYTGKVLNPEEQYCASGLARQHLGYGGALPEVDAALHDGIVCVGVGCQLQARRRLEGFESARQVAHLGRGRDHRV